jgi:F-type H+-transporting ATPase subunit delta
MTNKTAAMRYARALLDVGINEHADLDQIERDLDSFAALFAQFPELARALLNPVVPVPRKRAAVAELMAANRLTPMVAKLIALLADRDRLVLIPDVLAGYRDRLLNHRNVIRAEVTTTESVSADRSKAIEASLSRATGRTIFMTTKVDPGIIGGVVMRIGSTVYDGSIARQLERIRASLAERA